MPRGDGTGPAGMGPMSGRAAGYCAGYSTPGFANPIGRRGAGFFGGRFGRGRGFRNMYYGTGLPGWQRANMGMPAWGYYQGAEPYPFQDASQFAGAEDEKAFLKDQAEYLKTQMADIESRLNELEKDEKKEKK